jgi:hypothetical protein
MYLDNFIACLNRYPAWSGHFRPPGRRKRCGKKTGAGNGFRMRTGKTLNKKTVRLRAV